MKISRITDIIDTYSQYKTKIQKAKDDLFWEEVNNGENSLRGLKLKKQIQADEFELQKFKEGEV